MTPILNRDFAHPTDGWYHIEPMGEHANAAANVVQVIDAEACSEICNRFNAEADSQNFPGMLVDHEHFRHDAGQETRAFGWLMRLQNRDDGLYGEIRWTATGKAAVDGGDYRFFSTEYRLQDATVLNQSGPRRIRPLRLAGLTLTNAPNNRGAKPITNRAEEAQQPKEKNMMKVAAALGLPEDASEDQILAAIAALKGEKDAAQAEKEGMENRLKEAEAALLKNREAQADADLAPLADKLSAEERAEIREQLIANRKATLPLLKLVTAAQPKAGSILNRVPAQTPQTPEEDKDKAHAARAREYQHKNNTSYQAAWEATRN